ncbi:MAG: DUF4398 domain-containing protein [Methylobacter sp.]|nr:MAG: DUF4398 domain-containing protein [Methylobacter sp.]
MSKNLYIPMILIVAGLVSGCDSKPKNSLLTEAHNSYDNVRNNPKITNVDLKEAREALDNADQAFNEGESDTSVSYLANIAKQQVEIAQETAKRKAAELVVANTIKRDPVRLEEKTIEADITSKRLVLVEKIADRQAAALATADLNAKGYQAVIAQQKIELKALNAKETERGLVITLGDVLFDTNKALLKSNAMRNVQKLADFLTRYSQYKVLVEGHTDSVGSNDLNQALSDRRASAVRIALVDMGIRTDRVNTRGYGERFPIAGNDSAASRQLNRRVEIILSDNNGNIVPR